MPYFDGDTNLLPNPSDRKTGTRETFRRVFVDCCIARLLIGLHYWRFFAGAYLSVSSRLVENRIDGRWESERTKDGSLLKMIQRDRRYASRYRTLSCRYCPKFSRASGDCLISKQRLSKLPHTSVPLPKTIQACASLGHSTDSKWQSERYLDSKSV